MSDPRAAGGAPRPERMQALKRRIAQLLQDEAAAGARRSEVIGAPLDVAVAAMLAAELPQEEARELCVRVVDLIYAAVLGPPGPSGEGAAATPGALGRFRINFGGTSSPPSREP